MKLLVTVGVLVFAVVGSRLATNEARLKPVGTSATGTEAPPASNKVARAVLSTSHIDELLPFHMVLGGEDVVVDSLLLATRPSTGQLAIAYLVGTRPGGIPALIDQVSSYPEVTSDTEDIAGSFVDSQIPGERRRIDVLRFAVNGEGRMYVSYWEGQYEVSGTAFVLDFEEGGQASMESSYCCTMQLGIPSCSDNGCAADGGTCGTPPYSCACTGGTGGPGSCFSPAAIDMCYGHCNGFCEVGTCAHWIDPLGVEKCKCRGT